MSTLIDVHALYFCMWISWALSRKMVPSAVQLHQRSTLLIFCLTWRSEEIYKAVGTPSPYVYLSHLHPHILE